MMFSEISHSFNPNQDTPLHEGLSVFVLWFLMNKPFKNSLCFCSWMHEVCSFPNVWEKRETDVKKKKKSNLVSSLLNNSWWLTAFWHTYMEISKWINVCNQHLLIKINIQKIVMWFILFHRKVWMFSLQNTSRVRVRVSPWMSEELQHVKVVVQCQQWTMMHFVTFHRTKPTLAWK